MQVLKIEKNTIKVDYSYWLDNYKDGEKGSNLVYITHKGTNYYVNVSEMKLCNLEANKTLIMKLAKTEQAKAKTKHKANKFEE